MTVISTTLLPNCMVHVTDSLLRGRQAGQDQGGFENGSKFAKVSEFKGAMSWFGKVYQHPWDAIEFLERMSADAGGQTPDNFGRHIAEQLNSDGALLGIRQRMAMGIHFSFYEDIGGDLIPELLWITNYSGITGTGEYVIAEGGDFTAQRQTFFTLTKNTDFERHAEHEYRKVVSHFLQNNGPIEYNNGNPALFNVFDRVGPAVNHCIAKQQVAFDDEIDLAARTALFKVEAIAHFQERLFKDASRAVGNPCHYLVVLPDGNYLSDLPAERIHGR
jgi:hypothetical protein